MRKITYIALVLALFAVVYGACFRDSREPPMGSSKHIIIVGGGYAAGTVASQLQKHFKVTLIDTKPFFENVIANPRVAAEEGLSSQNRIEHAQYLKTVQVVTDRVVRIGKKHVELQSGQTLAFDYLVIATGSRSRVPFETEPGAPVVDLRNGLECEQALKDKLSPAKLVAVIGGGPAGVEVAAEIAEAFPNKQVHVIASQSTLLSGMHPSSGTIAESVFTKFGNVTIHREKRVTRVGRDGAIYVGDAEPLLRADVAFLAVGSRPNSELLQSAIDSKGYIRVNAQLQVLGHDNILAVGDVSNASPIKLAGHAMEQAECAIENIKAMEKGLPLTKYVDERKDGPVMISLGRSNGVFASEAGQGEASNSWLMSKFKNFASHKANRLPFI